MKQLFLGIAAGLLLSAVVMAVIVMVTFSLDPLSLWSLLRE